MKLSGQRVRELARRQDTTLTALLEDAGVSRTAYYSLLRRASVLPRSVHRLAAALGVTPAELLAEDVPPLVALARRICEDEPESTFENVWHTLNLLELDPLERLNRSLRRGRALAVH